MEGPQFSTRAESNLYRSWNVDVIGMTLAPEAKLAREAEMCLCGILTVTDYDCWYEDDDVDIKEIWSVKNGIIHCTGMQNGYVRTESEYANFIP